ncbi:hypothetical protein [Isoalcanivorax indicus]|uniref:hypothetical protein n=1 Tax=Isoalcanivorax indicus TaxID=2202653 RepID=UPI0013C52832|nr:hypothetical protein [Isoalcanivorax indicus]
MGRHQHFDDYDQDEWQEHHEREARQKQRRDAQRKRHQDETPAVSPGSERRGRRDDADY